ncbi:MAG: hypothetical protein JKY23_06525 [Nitrospinaceae bacterium]|nr:hypothetical protein [Nitrospinaceae bacterium]
MGKLERQVEKIEAGNIELEQGHQKKRLRAVAALAGVICVAAIFVPRELQLRKSRRRPTMIMSWFNKLIVLLNLHKKQQP